MTTQLVGAVLCGGLSRRMGRDKALLQIHPGIRQIDYAIGVLAPFCSRIIACTGPAGRPRIASLPGIAQVADRGNVEGPMAGILTALKEAQGLGVIALACDMPWVDEAVIATLISGRDASRLATAFVASDGQPEPMCAVYDASAREALVEFAASNTTSLRKFLTVAPAARLQLDDDGRLASINDPAELAEAREALAFNAGKRH